MKSFVPRFFLARFFGVTAIFALGAISAWNLPVALAQDKSSKAAPASESSPAASPSQSSASAAKPLTPASAKIAALKGPVQSADPAEQDGDADKEFEKEKDGPDAIRKREEWFYKQRSSVSGRIPAGARLRAFQHMQRMMEAEGKLVRRPDGSYAAVAPKAAIAPQASVTSAWTPIGPSPTTGGTFSPVTGRVTTIAVDPNDASGNTVLIGGAQGGIWRTTDAGATWIAVGDQNPSLAMGSIAFAPSQPATVYAGTGEQASIGFDIYYGAGVLKSTDHGQTWTQTCTVAGPTCPFIGPSSDASPFGFFTLGGTRISYVAVNPTNPQMVLVGAQTQFSQGPTEGVYCTDNGGASWSQVLADQMSTFVGFASSSVAYAALGDPFGNPQLPNGNGIYEATGVSTSCTSIAFARLASANLPAESSMGRIDLGISPNYAADKTIYASIADASTSSSTNLGVFVTADGGNSWTKTSAPDVCKYQCWYDNVVKVDPNNKNIAFFGGSSVTVGGAPSWVVRTTNGGASWSTVVPNALGPGLPHVDNHAIAFAKLPGGKVRMYLGNDGGIWRTDDAEAATVSWTNLNDSTLTLTQFYPSISINTSSPAIAFGGTQDNGSQNYQGGHAWVDNQLCGDGGTTAVDAVVPSTVYIGCGTGAPVNASYQNGAIGSFSTATNGINPNDNSSFVPPIVVDPNVSDVLYFGTTKIYQSADAALTWTAITGDLVNTSIDYINAIAVAPANSSVVYAGAFGGNVFVYTNVTVGNPPSFIGHGPNIPSRAVTAIAVDPADNTGGTAYVAYSGFSYVNANYGIYDPFGHIFKTTNSGNSWTDVSCSVIATATCMTPAATDLPNIPVNDIVIDPEVAGAVYAATDLGVYVGNCTATACTWSTLGTGLPHAAVLSLRLHLASRTLRAATHGRGAWDIFLNNLAFSGPRIFSITPTSANASGAQFTLTVNGTGLTGGAIQWNGASTGVTMIAGGTDTTLTATIASSLLVGGSAKITVKSSSVSNSVPFEVMALTPTLTSLNPPRTPVQMIPTNSVPIQLTGINFSSSAKVLFNGAQNGITTKFNSSTSLTATLPAALLGRYGSTNDISVLNAPPGGGLSKSVAFKVAAPSPPNDNFANAINITTLSFQDVQDSSGATTEPADPTPPLSCINQYTAAQGNTGGHPNGVYNTLWYKFTPVFSANLNVDTVGSGYDTVLSIWTGSAGSLVNVACNDDINPGINIQSQLANVPLTVGTTYYIMVSSFGPPDPNPSALGGQSQLNFNYNNGDYPTPTLTSISPTSEKSGDPAFTLTLNGSGFINGGIVQFQDSVSNFSTYVNATFVSSTQVTAVIPASAIVLPGTFRVYAYNPQPTGPSNPLSFTVNVGTYPVPTLSSIGPTAVAAGGIGFTLYALGTNFASTATLNVNGVAKPTNYSLPTALSAAISAADIASVGTAQITVSNPSPGGGTSNALPLSITAPNPVPTISSVSPATFQSGSNLGSVAIVGTNFNSQAEVYFNGTISGTYYTDSSHLGANVNTGALLGAGVYPLIVIDAYPGGMSAPFNITVTGPPDFSITSTGTTTQTVAAGQTATFTNAISIAAQNGFSAQVNLLCSLPISATATSCSVNPNLFATGSGSATVKVTTMTRGLVPPSLPVARYIPGRQVWPAVVQMLLISIYLARFARTRRQRLVGAIPFAVIALFLILEATGCGGGGGSGGPPPPTGTPAGTYTITVTATSGTLNHTTPLTLIVQ